MSDNNNHPQESLSRRELLKKIGAAGAILGARAIVPVNWAKPASESGLLPVHAQVSGVGTVNGFVWEGPLPLRPSSGPRVQQAAYVASIQSTALSVNCILVDTYYQDPNNQNNYYNRYSFSISNVPQGLRTVIAHSNTPCAPGDQNKNITVGPGTNPLSEVFIFAPCLG